MEGDASPVVLPNERQSSRCFRALADMAGSEHLQRLPATRRAWKSCLPLLYGLSGEDAEERKRSMSHWRGLFARVFLGNEDEGLDINTFREALKAMDRFEDLRRRKYEEIERPVLFDDIMAVDAVRDTSFWDESTEDQLARNDERLEMLDALHFKAEKRYERATLVLRKLYLDHCLKAAPFKKFQFIGHINFAFPGPQEDDTNDSYRVDFEHFQADSRGEMLNKLRKVEAALSKSKKPGKVDDTTVNLISDDEDEPDQLVPDLGPMSSFFGPHSWETGQKLVRRYLRDVERHAMQVHQGFSSRSKSLQPLAIQILLSKPPE